MKHFLFIYQDKLEHVFKTVEQSNSKEEALKTFKHYNSMYGYNVIAIRYLKIGEDIKM